MVDVFISYSRENQHDVAKLARAVTDEGYEVWWDDELPAHLSYSEVIAEKVGEAKAAIVVWSASAAASEWVRSEADFARSQKKLIQTAVDGTAPPMPFNQIQCASLEGWKGEPDHPGWRKVKASLEALCRRGAGGAAERQAIPASRQAQPAPSHPVPAPRARIRAPLLAGLAMLLILLGAGVAYLVLGGLRGESVATAQADEGTETKAQKATRNPQRKAAAGGSGAGEARRPPGGGVFAVMADHPDRFANIRAEPSAQAPIVGQIDAGHTFIAYPSRATWWRVRAEGGTEGYVNRNLIRRVPRPVEE